MFVLLFLFNPREIKEAYFCAVYKFSLVEHRKKALQDKNMQRWKLSVVR